MPKRASRSELIGSQKVVRFHPRGVFSGVFTNRAEELVLAGPAGTGKSRCAIELLHLRLLKYDNTRAIMVRKTRTSMTETCMQTFDREVVHHSEGVRWSSQDQKYYYPNGSELIVAGMDNPQKIMSSAYDLGYYQECVEGTENDWEMITTRLRPGSGSNIPYRQLMGDCNPDHPRHWLKKREAEGKLVMVPTRHQDNPILWNEKEQRWTEAGEKYVLGKLKSLTGVRYKRLYLGLWAAAEGAVYEEHWDRNYHVLPQRFQPPDEWERIWGFDFGFNDPFCWGEWVLSPNNHLILHRQIYMTKRTLPDHLKQIAAVTKVVDYPKFRPSYVICDHDAGERALIEQFFAELKVPIRTLPAYKNIATGINAVRDRLKQKDGDMPMLGIMPDSLVEKDPELVEKKAPLCGEEEFDSYAYSTKPTMTKREVPVDKDNHFMDMMRYVVCFVDNIALDPQETETTYNIGDECRVEVSRY